MDDLCKACTASVVQSMVFQPYDRILHRSMMEGIPMSSNLLGPFKGVFLAVFSRLGSQSVYFASQKRLENAGPKPLVGMLSGLAGSAISNVLVVHKYQSWNNRSIWDKCSIQARHFTAGLKTSMVRDMLFGAVYESLRVEGNVGENLGAGACAAAASSVPNYVRSVQLNWNIQLGNPPTTGEILVKFFKDGVNSDKSVRFWMARLKIGWGTARVAAGITLGQTIFEALK